MVGSKRRTRARRRIPRSVDFYNRSGGSSLDDVLQGERIVLGNLRIRAGRHRHCADGWHHVLPRGFVGDSRMTFDDVIAGRLEQLDNGDPREPAQVSAIQETLIFVPEGAAVEPWRACAARGFYCV